MRYFFTLIIVVIAGFAVAQQGMPYFLKGTWKVDGKEHYEHWDSLNAQAMKGFSYQLKGGRMVVSEYLEIAYRNEDVCYTATVINQNAGNNVVFKMSCKDSAIIFENPAHDFPKKIVYRRLSEKELGVAVSDGGPKEFSFRMVRQQSEEGVAQAVVANPEYDAMLAGKLGGDEYGMKRYFLVILKTGPDSTVAKNVVEESFKGHMRHMEKLVKDGKLVVAGPMEKNRQHYRGIFILNNVATVEEARDLLLNDPAIRDGLLDYELFSWYGSAALPEYLPVADKIWKRRP